MDGNKKAIRNLLLISGLSLAGFATSSYLVDRIYDRHYDRKPVQRTNGVYDIRIDSSDENGRRSDESYIVKYDEEGKAKVTILDDTGLMGKVKEKEVPLMSIAGVDFSIKRK